MRKRTEGEVRDFTVWLFTESPYAKDRLKEYGYDYQIGVSIEYATGNSVKMSTDNYSFLFSMNLDIMMYYAAFFETTNIKEESWVESGSCPTCDYGSDKGWEITAHQGTSDLWKHGLPLISTFPGSQV